MDPSPPSPLSFAQPPPPNQPTHSFPYPGADTCTQHLGPDTGALRGADSGGVADGFAGGTEPRPRDAEPDDGDARGGGPRRRTGR